MGRVDSLEKTLMLGGIGGKRRSGWAHFSKMVLFEELGEEKTMMLGWIEGRRRRG